jgi:hypothetical protein
MEVVFMSKLTVEVTGSHACTGYRGEMPEVVRKFADDTGMQVELKVYRAWDIDSEKNIPEYVWEKLSGIRTGLSSSHGFYLNKE